MNKIHLRGALCACSLVIISSTASAALLYDQNVTPDVIFGSGNNNGSFTVDQNNNIELGLRGKLRFDATGQPQNIFNSNGDGTYSFNAGVAPTKSSPVGVWSLEWSINSDLSGTQGRNLDALTYELGTDNDPTSSKSWSTSDLINVATPAWADHAIGDNTTGNGAGVAAANRPDYLSLIATNNVAQNSWQAHWLVIPFDPTVAGEYSFYLAAFDNTGQLARTDITVIVSAVPVPAAFWLFGSGLLGLVGIARRKKAA